MNRKILLFIALSMFDVITTDYVLALGGEEVNPVFNYFLQIGWTVWETKIALSECFAYAIDSVVDYFKNSFTDTNVHNLVSIKGVRSQYCRDLS